jgi:hypothetical protein
MLRLIISFAEFSEYLLEQRYKDRKQQFCIIA